MRGNRVLLLAVTLFFSLATNGWAEMPESPFKLSGYYKSIFSLLDFPLDDAYSDFSNRLRLRLDIDMGEYLSGVVEYDLEGHLGNFKGSFPDEVSGQLAPPQFLDLERELLDEDDLYARHKLNRLFLRLALPSADIKAGRYVIDWGTGRAWNPTDPFYPVNPLSIEREERTGTDAVGVEFYMDGLSSLAFVLAGQGKRGEHVQAVRYRTNIKGTDLALTGFHDRVFSAGVDLSRTFWNTELHAALRHGEDGTNEWVVGLDRSFRDTLKLGVEYYRNSEGASQREDYEWLDWFEGGRQFLARDYLFGWADYEITPLLRLQTYAMGNLADGGLFLNPVVKYSTTANTELALGYVYFDAEPEDEFCLYPEVWYLQFQAFF